MRIVGVRWSISDSEGAGQMPITVNLIVEAAIDGERVHGIYSIESEFNTRQLFIGPSAMRTAWDAFEDGCFDDEASFKDVRGLSRVYKEISDSGEEVIKDDARYAELEAYIASLMNRRWEFLEDYKMI